MNLSKRYPKIDILYTIGILLVLFGHSHSSDWSTFEGTILQSAIEFVYTFHMHNNDTDLFCCTRKAVVKKDIIVNNCDNTSFSFHNSIYKFNGYNVGGYKMGYCEHE